MSRGAEEGRSAYAALEVSDVEAGEYSASLVELCLGSGMEKAGEAGSVGLDCCYKGCVAPPGVETLSSEVSVVDGATAAVVDVRADDGNELDVSGP